jgi:hypothetical protein
VGGKDGRCEKQQREFPDGETGEGLVEGEIRRRRKMAELREEYGHPVLQHSSSQHILLQ